MLVIISKQSVFYVLCIVHYFSSVSYLLFKESYKRALHKHIHILQTHYTGPITIILNHIIILVTMDNTDRVSNV